MIFTSRNYLFFFSLFLLLFLGCSKDRDDVASAASPNNRVLGTSANDFLADDVFRSLKIEILYVEGFAPSTAALESLITFLQKYTKKPEGITIVKSAIVSPQSEPFTTTQVRELEDSHRTVFNRGDRLGVFIFFANTKSAKQEENKLILGTAYRNTSMVIFEKTVQELSKSSLVPEATIEATAMKHEFGHLFGLVNIGSPSQIDHEDTENDSHCTLESCLMAAEIAFGSGTVKLLKQEENIEFGKDCLLDLQANGGK